MELQTTLNGADVTVHYTAEQEEVDCYDAHSGTEYTGYTFTFTVDSVDFMGVDIASVISESDMTALEMECQAAYEGVEA